MKTSVALFLAALAHQVAATGQPLLQSETNPPPSDSLTTATSKITASSINVDSSTVTPRPTTWTAMGCYSQDRAQPILEERMAGKDMDIFMSIGMCTNSCSLGNFPFAGLHAGNQCWCGTHVVGELARNQSDCNVPCPGYPRDTCGGVSVLNVYKAEGIDRANSSTITKAPSTSTSSGRVLTTVLTAGAMKNLAIFGW